MTLLHAPAHAHAHAPALPLDADLGDALAAGLLPGGRPRDLAAFERAFVRHVEAQHPDPDRAWDRFYDATLARVRAGWHEPPQEPGTVAAFTRIWSRAAALVRGTVLDVGCCFGFLPLLLASSGPGQVLALDLAEPSLRLAGRQARRLGREVRFVRGCATRLPLAERSVGTVLLVHVLEHLPPPQADAVLAEALRVADRRVVVAVPVEDVPDPVFGHVQVYDAARLGRTGAATGWRSAVGEGDGAWLVLDRP